MRGALTGRMRSWLAVLLRVERWPRRLVAGIERAREVLAFTGARARDVRLEQVAGSLTFTTTLSIVPLLAVALSVFSAFPLFAEYRGAVEQFLRELLPPQFAATVLRYLAEFTERAARLTAVGLAFLVVTALLMIRTVDDVLNSIFEVQTRRGPLARMLVYWALLTLGPLVIGASFSVSTYLFALSAEQLAASAQPLLVLLDLGPFLLRGLALSALYVLVPNRRVRWSDALIGGFVASALGEALGQGFAVYLRGGTLAGIYGAFAIAPLLLLWIYLSWYALLFGAAIAATLPALRATRFADERRAGNRFVTSAALLALLLAARGSGEDDGRVGTEALARRTRVADDAALRLLLELERLGYVSRLDGAHAGKWLLTCDPQQTSLKPLFEALAVDPRNSLLAAQPELARWLGDGLGSAWLARPLAEALGKSAAGERRMVV